MFTGARSRFVELNERGDQAIGAWVTAADSSTTAIFGEIGHDFVIIDGEHGALGVRDILLHIRAAQATGTAAIVRVLKGDPTQIQQVVDLGADGVLVPKVETAEQAAACYAATQYRAGGRGFCPMVPAAGWSGENWTEHASRSNREVIFIPLIETVAGVDNFEAIAAVDGVEFAFFGLGDLAQDMGTDMYAGREQLLRIWEDCRDKAERVGLRLGAPGGLGFEGTSFMTIGGDLNYVRATGAERLAKFRSPVRTGV
ncbi:aldolase/citrate lyase family protein [Salinibacterium sp. ZJ454]|uniref:HpcH/HpaI aldolase family protein n=1 Tax=Salinibacterium sp. ZJ454 TaxID=2708339 RepID=UPI0014216E7C|nr:aldolase/citrate lyase family protein [Salinibacterium sp. ZJ454]